jgi:holliday junction DNA helicase RuvA
MFNSISGKLTFKNKEKVYLRNGGIEWDISISATTHSNLPEEGIDCTLYVFLNHKEDKMQLIGFSSVEERKLFFDLIKVESIGPASALKILSGITAESLGRAIENGDAGILAGIPGIGKKTAEKIVFKLKGKITVAEEEPLYEELARALSGMGFDPEKSRIAVREAAKEIDFSQLGKEVTEAELLKTALKRLSKSHG